MDHYEIERIYSYIDARVVGEACQGAAELQMNPSVDYAHGTRKAQTSVGLASVENMIFSSLAGNSWILLPRVYFISIITFSPRSMRSGSGKGKWID